MSENLLDISAPEQTGTENFLFSVSQTLGTGNRKFPESFKTKSFEEIQKVCDDDKIRKRIEEQEISKDVLVKLDLIDRLKSGDGLIISTSIAREDGVLYLERYIDALKDAGCLVIESQVSKGWEIRYNYKSYHVTIPQLRRDELYPEMVIRRIKK